MSEKHLRDQLHGLFSGIGPLDSADAGAPEEMVSVRQGGPLKRGSARPAIPKNLVTFRLDRQVFALPIEPIVQIVEMVTITPLPQASDSLEGVINVRGAAVPVVNLRRHFGMAETPQLLDAHIILVRHKEQMVGLIVDQVLSVLDLTGSQLVQTVDMIPHELGNLPLLQGLVLGKNETVLLLDLAQLLLPQHRMAIATAVLAAEEEE